MGKSYFGNVQKLYNLFALSPGRWKILVHIVNIMLTVIWFKIMECIDDREIVGQSSKLTLADG